MLRLSLAALLITPVALPISAPALAAAPVHLPTRFSVVVEGHGPDVILIPGLSSTRDVWAATAADLRGRYRVHMVQLKGFGEPAGANASGPVLRPFVDDLATYIRANRLKQPAVIGHSMGGLAALMLGTGHPGVASRIMVVDSLAFIGPLFGAADVAAVTPRAGAMRAMMLARPGQTTPDFTLKPDCPGAEPVPSGEATMTNSALGACLVGYGGRVSDPRVVAQAMFDDMVTDMRGEVGRIQVPLTVLHAGPRDGDYGKLYTASYAGKVGVKLVGIPGSAHFIMQDQPRQFAEQVSAFLR
ncbi:alpha/beta hydrolase [Sphingomonas sp. BN140010]|uniref:Alpha/beta hydrolase n=1 Tax=Sphingomonas arvum TaxID=2992113 RepID=A0ABT3JGG2_9SPHN|nr:alpha/beta hydrolase [Sphingomonas sp. BN140010]MCW3797876.1 alpha/beta hydrolase [Sphingomonas sp. BN140010]